MTVTSPAPPLACDTSLTDGELRRYRELGYIGPFPLLDDTQITQVLREWERTRDQLPWYKGHHVYRGPISEALASDAVVGRIASILGEDVMLWGSQIIGKRGGKKHRWHVDVETMAWTSVNFWAALRHVSAKATVLLLPGTQRLKVSPQELERTEQLDITDSNAVQRAAAARGVVADIIAVDIPPGTFVLFDGHLWHGSINDTLHFRTALLAQYSPTSEHARIPRTYVPPIQWDLEPAPCLLVRGKPDPAGHERYVEPAEPPKPRLTIAWARSAIGRVVERAPRARASSAFPSVCLVGIGAAADRHVHALRAVAGEAVRISAVARDHVRVEQWVGARGAARAYRNLDEAMDGDDDIIVIATPPSSHAQHVDRAMAAGKHLLVEKPAFRSLDELVARLPAIRRYPRVWMVAENSHFSPMQRLVVERVREGAIGDPIMTTIHRMRRRIPTEAWKATRAESEGALHEGGIHWIRVGLALTGVATPSEVEWVFASEPGTKLIANEGDDTALVSWRTRKGALGELGHSWALEGGRMPLGSAVVGTEGAIYFELSGRIAMIAKQQLWQQRPLVPWRAIAQREDLSGTVEMWRRFLASVCTGQPVAHTVDEATVDLGVIDAAYRSLASRVPEPLDARLVQG